MDKCIPDTDILSEYLKGHDSVVIGHAAQHAHEHRVFSFTSAPFIAALQSVLAGHD